MRLFVVQEWIYVPVRMYVLRRNIYLHGNNIATENVDTHVRYRRFPLSDGNEMIGKCISIPIVSKQSEDIRFSCLIFFYHMIGVRRVNHKATDSLNHTMRKEVMFFLKEVMFFLNFAHIFIVIGSKTMSPRQRRWCSFSFLKLPWCMKTPLGGLFTKSNVFVFQNLLIWNFVDFTFSAGLLFVRPTHTCCERDNSKCHWMDCYKVWHTNF